MEWLGHPSIVLGLGAALAAYAYAARRTEGLRPRTAQVVFFGSALLAIYLALASPLHDLSERSLFSAHMVQHVLLTLIAPPLLLAGIPGWMIRPLAQPSVVRGILGVLTSPLPAFLIFNVVFGVSHVPRLYDLVLGDHPLHIVEHLVFLASAILAWWPILSPLSELPRLPYPLQVLYLFLQTVPGSIVGAMITLADQPLYTVYAAAPRVWGISPIADQQIGGLIMWVGGGAFFLIAATTVFFIWAAREDAHAAA